MAGPYEVRIRASAEKELRAIGHRADQQRLVERIEALGHDPRPPGCVKLTGANAYRVRQGRYRIVYTVADAVLTVEVVRIGHRRDVYR